MSDEEILNGIRDPTIRAVGLAATGAAAVYGGFYKIKQSMGGGKSPTETAITNLLPQAFTRAALGINEANKIVQAQLVETAGIEGLKHSLKTAIARDEKVHLWSEIVLQSYVLLLVAPHVTSTLIASLALRSAVGVLAHLQQSAGMGLDETGDNLLMCPSERKSIVRTFFSMVFSRGGAKTALTEAVMGHLTSLLGSNAFAVDDADNANAETEGNAVSPLAFGQSEIVDILCAKMPLLMHKARLCLMEQLGMVSDDAMASVLEATGRGASDSCKSSTFRQGGSLVDVSQKAPLAEVEAAVWRAHAIFFQHVIDWQGDVFGSSSILFRELESEVGGLSSSHSACFRESSRDPEPNFDGSEEIIVASNATNDGSRELSITQQQPLSLFGFSSGVDPVLADRYRKIVKRYMQDLLTCGDVNIMLRTYGLENFRYWWSVTFFHTEIAGKSGDRASPSPSNVVTPAASPKASVTVSNVDNKDGVLSLSPAASRALAVCKSFDPSTTTVRLLEFALAVDKSRQALLMNPFFADVAEGRPCLSIPFAIKAFCEELVRASGSR